MNHDKKTDFKSISAEVIHIPIDVDDEVKAIQEIVGGYFECHYTKLKTKKLTVYVNDEAMLRDDLKLGFVLGSCRPLFGNAVILGIENLRADSSDCPLTPSEILKAISMVTKN